MIKAALFLTFMACQSDNQVCQKVELFFDGPASGCAIQGQFEIIEWLRQRPWMELKGGWKCETGVEF